jgi:glycosyltransferase involved in cell wall biosynthesis
MKISILILAYNHENYICEAIDSILMQKHEFEMEVIVLDDASSDRTFELVSSKARANREIQLIRNDENLGITKNYQKGFGICGGKYVFVLEGDDYWTDALKIKRQVEFLEQQPFCSMCFHPFLIQKNASGEIHNQFSNINNGGFDLFGINEMILNEGLIANFSVCCYRKKFLDQLSASLFEIVSYDWIVNIAMAQFGFLGRLNTIMSVYRLSETGTWSNKKLQEKLSETVKLIPDYDRILEHKYTNLFQQKIRLLQDQIKKINTNQNSLKSFFPPIIISLVKLLTPPVLLNYLKRK